MNRKYVKTFSFDLFVSYKICFCVVFKEKTPPKCKKTFFFEPNMIHSCYICTKIVSYKHNQYVQDFKRNCDSGKWKDHVSTDT